MAGPVCSVIIVNWNSLSELKSCLRALELHSVEGAQEVIVIDNASYDGSEQYCRELEPVVRFLQSRSNLGFAAANNLGASVASGEYLLFLNPDAEVTAGAIERLISALESDGRIAGAGAKLLNSDGSLQASCVLPFPSVLNALLDAGWLRTLAPRLSLWGAHHVRHLDGPTRSVQAVSGACVLVRRSVYESVGGFSEDYFMYAEDVDLCWRIRRLGYRTVHVPSAEVVHHGGRATTGKRVSKFATVLQRQSDWLCVRKFRGPLYAAAYRAVSGLVACGRLCVLLPAALFLLPVRRQGLARALAKWQHVLSWVLWSETWCSDAAAMRR